MTDVKGEGGRGGEGRGGEGRGGEKRGGEGRGGEGRGEEGTGNLMQFVLVLHCFFVRVVVLGFRFGDNHLVAVELTLPQKVQLFWEKLKSKDPAQ